MHVLVCGSAVARNVFLTCQDYKKVEKLEKLVMHTCLGPGAKVLFRHKRMKMATDCFYFILLVDRGA